MKKLCWLSLIVILSCVAGQPNLYRPIYFYADIPDGWQQVETDKFWMITKDGTSQQYALVQERPIEKPFKWTRRILHQRMLPEEAAAIIINEISRDENIVNFKLIQNIPISIDGKEGFQLLFTHEDHVGFFFQTVYYGFINEPVFITIRYAAKSRQQFNQDWADFEKVLESFKIVKEPKQANLS